MGQYPSVLTGEGTLQPTGGVIHYRRAPSPVRAAGRKAETSTNIRFAPRREDRNPANAGMPYAQPQLFIDTFQIPNRTGKKKHNPSSNVSNTKPREFKKRTARNESVPKRTLLTPEARRERKRTSHKEKLERAKSLGTCRHCGEPAILGQTRCEQCAERHRISRRTYNRRRPAPQPTSITKAC